MYKITRCNPNVGQKPGLAGFAERKLQGPFSDFENTVPFEDLSSVWRALDVSDIQKGRSNKQDIRHPNDQLELKESKESFAQNTWSWTEGAHKIQTYGTTKVHDQQNTTKVEVKTEWEEFDEEQGRKNKSKQD